MHIFPLDDTEIPSFGFNYNIFGYNCNYWKHFYPSFQKT